MRSSDFLAMNAVSAAVDQVSNVIDAQMVVNMSAIAIVTGTSTGTLNIQVSNDQPSSFDTNGRPVITNWTVPTGITVSVTGAGTFVIVPFEFCYRWARVQFVHGNGAAGTITVNVKSNGF